MQPWLLTPVVAPTGAAAGVEACAGSVPWCGLAAATRRPRGIAGTGPSAACATSSAKPSPLAATSTTANRTGRRSHVIRLSPTWSLASIRELQRQEERMERLVTLQRRLEAAPRQEDRRAADEEDVLVEQRPVLHARAQVDAQAGVDRAVAGHLLHDGRVGQPQPGAVEHGLELGRDAQVEPGVQEDEPRVHEARAVR